MWVVEMVGCVTEGVDFEFGKEVLGKFLQEPVDDHTTFNATLAVKNEDYFVEIGVVERFFYYLVAVADIVCGEVEVALY